MTLSVASFACRLQYGLDFAPVSSCIRTRLRWPLRRRVNQDPQPYSDRVGIFFWGRFLPFKKLSPPCDQGRHSLGWVTSQ